MPAAETNPEPAVFDEPAESQPPAMVDAASNAAGTGELVVPGPHEDDAKGQSKGKDGGGGGGSKGGDEGLGAESLVRSKSSGDLKKASAERQSPERKAFLRGQPGYTERQRVISLSSAQDRAPAVVERMAKRNEADWRSIAEGFGASPDETEMDSWMRVFERHCAADFEEQMTWEVRPGYHKTTTFAFLDITPFCRNAMSAIVEDSFTKCFESKEKTRWDNTFYLLPLSWMGALIRYCVLFPIRLLIVFAGLGTFTIMYTTAAMLLGPEAKNRVQKRAVWTLVMFFLWSWCAVVLEKGEIPPREPGQIYVANHSTVIDVVVLLKGQIYSLTGQAHEGTIGFFQKYVLTPMGNLWFNRKENKDRVKVAKAIEEHSMDLTKPPLLVFPEGTCVNNEYVVMFKQGAFQLGKSVVPVAIKYNKVFVDAYWNSRTTSFPRHLVRFMTSWALVCEVSYLDPQYRMPGESAINFAARVKEMIAKEAGIGSVPWNGMLKYYKPRPEYKSNRQRIYAKMLKKRFQLVDDDSSPAISPSPNPSTTSPSPEPILEEESKKGR